MKITRILICILLLIILTNMLSTLTYGQLADMPNCASTHTNTYAGLTEKIIPKLDTKPDKKIDKSLLKGFTYENNRNFITRKYILGPNDVLKISFLGVPELDQDHLRVQPDGNIVIPLLGAYNVAGLSIEELKNVLSSKYKYYLKDPQISINLLETKPFIVYVSGAVLNPGSYEIDTNTSEQQIINNSKPDIRITRKTPILSNILVAAGGILYDADLEHVKIVNKIDNSDIEINLLELLENGNSNQDIYLMADDTIIVPRLPIPQSLSGSKYKKYASATISPKAIPVRILGYVNNPGLIYLDPSQTLGLNSAISAAGGYLKDSPYSPKTVYLSRIDNNGLLITQEVNPTKKDLVLMPNDIVYVPEKIRPIAGRVFDYMSRLFNPVNSFANTYNNWALMFDPKRYQVIGK